ncbi:IS3-Spn1 transposase [Streptococcus pneumoniae]|nr:IS3-Spn1 transposase [Streptococcus pneumoniae]CWL44876.1 IS3-Spn1 transposase [Streptococcus pneumoniae]
MLEQAFKEKHYENTILHSDQGWQYQHDSYHRFLESKGIQASMSRPKFQVEVSHPKEIHLATCSPSIF